MALLMTMEKKSDRELLELAAKAAGLEVSRIHQEQRDLSLGAEKASLWIKGGSTAWNPLREDGDALRLAVKLGMDIEFYCSDDGENSRGNSIISVYCACSGYSRIKQEDVTAEIDSLSATRRAIVRSAAEIGMRMQDEQSTAASA